MLNVCFHKGLGLKMNDVNNDLRTINDTIIQRLSQEKRCIGCKSKQTKS